MHELYRTLQMDELALKGIMAHKDVFFPVPSKRLDPTRPSETTEVHSIEQQRQSGSFGSTSAQNVRVTSRVRSRSVTRQTVGAAGGCHKSSNQNQNLNKGSSDILRVRRSNSSATLFRLSNPPSVPNDKTQNATEYSFASRTCGNSQFSPRLSTSSLLVDGASDEKENVVASEEIGCPSNGNEKAAIKVPDPKVSREQPHPLPPPRCRKIPLAPSCSSPAAVGIIKGEDARRPSIM